MTQKIDPKLRDSNMRLLLLPKARISSTTTMRAAVPVNPYHNLKPSFSVTNWSGFVNTATGYQGWSNSLFPGNNRTLNPGQEAEWYADPTDPANNPFNPFLVMPNKHLQINAIRQQQSGFTWISGLLGSQGIFTQTYGSWRVQARIQAGPGLRPAVWMLAANGDYGATGEIDIGEWWQGDTVNVHQTVHGTIDGTWQSPYIETAVSPDAINSMHTYRVDWEPDFITMYVDNKITGHCVTPSGMNVPFFLILNLAIGEAGSWCGTPDAATNEAWFRVGDIEVYPSVGPGKQPWQLTA